MQIITPEFTVLLYIIALDYITGVGVAIFQKKVSSSIGRKGIFQKFGIIICVILCQFLDLLGNTSLLTIVCLFFIINESFSIIENLGKLNVPIPQILRKTLKSLQPEEEKIKTKK